MNILDIAIAKKLAGGGGGSGTDNYNDLSNLPKINDTTLSGNKSSSALGLQSEINSDSKLASDLVDDTNQDNKFVTSTEKNTWNGKQNAIDSDHKLSSDLVDDANHTNKFVTSTEKNTWNAKQNAIDADHKLSSSLVSFSTAEAAALASGIDSSKVGQISTNQTNILYSLEKVGKNDFNFSVWLEKCGVSNGSKTVTDNSITLTATGSDCCTFPEAANYPVEARVPVSADETIVFSWNYSPLNSQSNDVVGIFGNGDYTSFRTASADAGILEYTVPNGVTFVTIRVGVTTSGNSATYSDMMISRKSVYDANPTYQQYSRPNYDLTKLEAEDRAALVECVDKGAKNLAVPTLVSGSKDNLNFTLNSDNSVSMSGYNGSGTDYIEFGYIIPTKTGKYVLNGAPSDNRISIIIAIGSTTYAAINNTYPVTSVNLTAGTRYSVVFTITVPQSSPISIPVVAKPMVCTIDDWRISEAYAPYRKNLDQLEATKAPALDTSAQMTSGSLDDITDTSFIICDWQVTGKPSGLTNSAWGFVRTTIADSNTALQEFFAFSAQQSDNGVSFVRVKQGGTWQAWKQITNA